MEKNITEYFLRARESCSNLSEDAVRKLLNATLEKVSFGKVDWDIGIENWARILKDDFCVVMICTKLPLMILKTGSVDDLSDLKDRFSDWVYIEAKSFDDKVYGVSYDLLEQIFCKKLSDNLDYEELSLNDLWWTTVT